MVTIQTGTKLKWGMDTAHYVHGKAGFAEAGLLLTDEIQRGLAGVRPDREPFWVGNALCWPDLSVHEHLTVWVCRRQAQPSFPMYKLVCRFTLWPLSYVFIYSTQTTAAAMGSLCLQLQHSVSCQFLYVYYTNIKGRNAIFYVALTDLLIAYNASNSRSINLFLRIYRANIPAPY